MTSRLLGKPNLNFSFAILDWAAWAPGITSAAQWLEWTEAASLPTGDAMPSLPEMPAMARRRLSPLGRMAAQVAYQCHGDQLGMPVIFASRYGDAARSIDLLGDLARDEPLSPTAFGLSVHNAIGATYSITRGDRSNYLSVAAGAGSAAAALVEAAGLLDDGAPQAMVVCYDAPLPGPYAEFDDEPAAPYAWALRVAAAAPAQPHLVLSTDGTGETMRGSPTLPFGLDLLRFALGHEHEWRRTAGSTHWTLQRHG
jgi:hypothetical protein